MSEKRRILVLTLSFGSGHIRAAQSIVAELHKQMPEAEIRLIDALENCSLPFRAFYVWTYWAMIRRAPRVWKKFFAARVERRDAQTAPVWVWRQGCRKVFAEIRKFQPDLIVAAEVGACEIAAIARRGKQTNARIINVITDFEAEPIWVKPEISAYAVASERVGKQLENWGANHEKIRVCGIPLDAKFSEKHDGAKTRRRFGLDERPIVLLMGGGMGPTRMSEVAARLLQTGSDLNIVALPAKDTNAKAELEKLQSSPTVSLLVVGWTNLTAELMQSAVVLATKPGGLTLSEAAACALPCVLFDQIPGPEEENAKHFIEQGAGVQTHGSKETAVEIWRLLENREERRRLSANAQKLARTDASEKIVGLILDTLEQTPIVEKIISPAKRLSSYRKIYGAWRKLARQRQNSVRRETIVEKSEVIGNFQETISGTDFK